MSERKEYICQDCGKKQNVDIEYIDRDQIPKCAWCLGFLRRDNSE